MRASNFGKIFSLVFAREAGQSLTMNFVAIGRNGADVLDAFSHTFADDNLLSFSNIWESETGLTTNELPATFKDIRFSTTESFLYTRVNHPGGSPEVNVDPTKIPLYPAVAAGLLTELP